MPAIGRHDARPRFVGQIVAAHFRRKNRATTATGALPARPLGMEVTMPPRPGLQRQATAACPSLRWWVITAGIAFAAAGFGHRWGIPDPAGGLPARWSITALENAARSVFGISMVLWAVFAPPVTPSANEP